ncbi:MAG: hypothetical protein IJP96_07135, partial [Synergistaceae bacterium]|nr:hypothetical protein [Synergistaceae bacterium]
RLRACKDVKLLLDTVSNLSVCGEGNRETVEGLSHFQFRMVLAPTLPFEEFFKACKSYGWK